MNGYRIGGIGNTSRRRARALEERYLLSTLTVLNTNDSGAGSLRAEIAAANSGDTIVFAHSVHDITLTSGQLAVTQSLTIDGPGVNKLTISGNNASRVFDVSNGASVTIDDLTIANGATVGALGSGGIGAGGGLDNSTKPGSPLSTASIIDAIFAGNKAVGGAGGAGANGGNGVGAGIDIGFYALVGFTDNSFLTMSGSTIKHNVALGGDGGSGTNGGDGLGGLAVQTGSSATVSDSSIKHNKADGGEEGAGGSDGNGVGGGAYSVGTLDLTTTTVANNDASNSNDNIFP